MNNCSFFGKISKMALSYQDSVPCMDLELSVENFRKSKSGKKIVENSYLVFVAWDSAAETLNANAKNGDFLLVKEAEARNWDDDRIYFRINEFKILKNVEEIND